jgi:hypothetical protein
LTSYVIKATLRQRKEEMMAELTPGSVQQLLEVLDRTRRNFKQGVPQPTAYQDAVRDVSRHYGVTYQTIGDLCRRRLAFREISEFMFLLDRWLRGDSEQLRRRLRQRSAPTTHDIIDRFFKAVDSKATASPKALPVGGAEPVVDYVQTAVPTRASTEEIRLRLTPELRQRLQLAYLAKIGRTIEDTAIALLESGFDSKREEIRLFLNTTVGTT